MKPFALALFTIPLIWASSPDQLVDICLDDRVRIDNQTAKAFDKELSLLSGSTFRLVDRKRSLAKCIRISIRSHAPARYQGALGLAFTADGRVLPAIDLYVSNIQHTLGGVAGSERFGRALAKVAFHELQHYVRQERHHDVHGLFAPALSGTQLLSSAVPD